MKKTLLTIAITAASFTSVAKPTNTLSLAQGDIEGVAALGFTFDVAHENIVIGAQFLKGSNDNSSETACHWSACDTKSEFSQTTTNDYEVNTFGLYTGYEFPLNENFKLTPTIGYAWTSYEHVQVETRDYTYLKKVSREERRTYESNGAAEVGLRLTLDNTIVIGMTHSFNDKVNKSTMFILGFQF